MEEKKTMKKRVRDDSESPESGIDSPEVKKLRENLLGSLDDDPYIDALNQDLDSFMKSFEDEIIASPSAAVSGGGAAETVAVDLASDSSESGPDLGYLLEASDDELGIPPPLTNESKNELVRVASESSDLGGEFLEVPECDAYVSGFWEADNYNGGYEAIDGLFDYSDLGHVSCDYAWRSETLPTQ